MFGIGFEELAVIGLLALVLFGPQKLPSMARDLGRFVSEAQNTVEEFKSELLSEEVEARRAAEKIKSELLGAPPSDEEQNEPAHYPAPGEGATRKPKEGRKPARKEEAFDGFSLDGLKVDTRSGRGHERTSTRWKRLLGGKR